jgi:hypothetical protein
VLEISVHPFTEIGFHPLDVFLLHTQNGVIPNRHAFLIVSDGCLQLGHNQIEQPLLPFACGLIRFDRSQDQRTEKQRSRQACCKKRQTPHDKGFSAKQTLHAVLSL